MESYFINRPNLDRLVKSLGKTYKVFAPIKRDDHLFYKKVNETGLESVVIGEIRSTETIKSFFFPARFKVSEYFTENIEEDKSRPYAIIGAKSCDIVSLKIMDSVFKEDPFSDPAYIKKRDTSLIISSDCTTYSENCFCTALGITPYPRESFDINLSELESGYVVEVGSDKGEKIIREYSKLFQTADLYLEKRNDNRKRLQENIENNLRDKNIPERNKIQGFFKEKFDSDLWDEVSKTCVECGACNVTCPACHCFLLLDQNKEEGGFERLRVWDSCLLMSFARVAGGGNPRKLLKDRLRNRFDKKFNFFPDKIGSFGCTGCGRCTEACPGKIDIKDVLSRLEG